MDLFNACDLNGNGIIELDVVITLIQCVAPQKFKDDQVISMFQKYSMKHEFNGILEHASIFDKKFDL